MSNVTISTTGLPDDYCFTTPQQYAVDLAAVLEGNFQYSTLFSTGNSTPAASLRTRPWFRYNSDGTPDDWYVYASGNWLAKHPLPTGAVMLYGGTEASIPTFDGGESATVTPTTGPFLGEGFSLGWPVPNWPWNFSWRDRDNRWAEPW